MNKEKVKNITIVLLILIIIILVVILVIKINDKKNEKEIKNTDNSTIENIGSNNNNIEDNTSSSTTNDVNSSNSSTTTNYTEDDVVSYVTTLTNDVSNETNLDKFKSEFKDKFITIVDFIFYDTEIKGYKFRNLTTSAKLKVINAAIIIDSKIEAKIPNYKETLSSKYNTIKDKLVMLYLDTTISVCKNSEDECNKAKEMFGELKSSTKIGFDYLKNILVNGKNKVKDYYEIYRDS